MKNDTQLPLQFQGYSGKKLEADFDGGTVTSDGGVLFLRAVEARIGIIRKYSDSLQDTRCQGKIDHTIPDMLGQRIYQIACGYEDGNDCNELRSDPGFKTACERLPESDPDLASQPTMSRLENTIRKADIYRLSEALLDSFIGSYGKKKPVSIILDMDDTDDTTHGNQQQSLFNGYYNDYCYMPLHVYEGNTGKLIASLLRTGRRMNGREIVSILKRLGQRIRKAWPKRGILFRGDSHFGCPEVYQWVEANDVDYTGGSSVNKRFKDMTDGLLSYTRADYNATGKTAKRFAETVYRASSWSKDRRIIIKAEVGPQGDNLRFVATNLTGNRPAVIYKTMYCARGRCELFIKNHKTYLKSDRTSCHRFVANQFRLLLHSAAYVLLHTLTREGLRGTDWATAQFDTIQKRLLKIGTRVREMATRIRFYFPTSYPLKDELTRLHYTLAVP